MLELKFSFLLLFLASASVVMVSGNPVPLPWFVGGPCDSGPCKNGGTCKQVVFGYECTCAKGWKDKQCTTKVQCEKPLDLLLVVDTASWQRADYFKNVAEYMADLINLLKISDRATEVGLITFSYPSSTEVQFLPGTYSDSSKLQSILQSVKPNAFNLFGGLEGSTAKALKLANDQVFKTADEHPNAAKAIVLLTSQPPLDSKSGAIEEANKLKAKGVNIVSIDLLYALKTIFDPKTAYEELSKISSPLKPIESEYFDLDEHVREVTDLLCSFAKDPCDGIECEDTKICAYDRDTTWCECEQSETDCEVHPCNKTETPCKNGAVCEELEGQFVCQCTEGWEGTTCEEKVHPCEKSESPCKNEGVCEKDEDEFICKCTEDWTGKTCEIKVHPCEKSESPCKNEGICEKDEDEFICKCTEDWTGKTCEIKVHPCDKSESPCKNEGVCEKDEDEFICKCTEDWTGKTCEIKVHPCDKSESPCKNEGVCEKDEDEFICKCTEDWTGKTCEIKVRPCDSSPCQNDAICENKRCFYACHCREGYEGFQCENKVTPCHSSPCKNGATCEETGSDAPDGFNCKCASGYEGVYCDKEIVPCEDSPCKNGGTCVADGETYVCRCESGYEGPTCEQEVHACDSDPCKNGAICNKQGDGFTCICTDEYKGETCEEEVSPCDNYKCLNEGECTIGDDGEPSCKCKEGFTGEKCGNAVVVISACAEKCQNGGVCKDQKCQCAYGYGGDKCERTDTIGFYKFTTRVYVKTENLPSLDAMTVCLRVYTVGKRSIMFFMSYATKSGLKFTFYKFESRLGANVGNARQRKISKKAVINDRKCHHICFTWKSAGGQYAFYKDGKPVGSGGGLSAGQRIPGGGVLSLAQRSVKPSLAVRYVGRITGVNIWNKVLTRQDIEKMSKCGASTVGNVKSWADFKLQGSSEFAKYVKNVCPLGANCGAS